MIFNSLIFITLFLPSVCFFYWLFRKLNIAFAEMFLILSNFLYIYLTNPKNVLPLLIIIFMNWGLGFFSCTLKNNKINWIAIVIDVMFLLYFKYCNFIINSVNSVFRINIANIVTEDIVGISFIVFMLIAYSADIIKGRPAEKNLRKFLFSITFFAKITQGPITRYQYQSEGFSIKNISDGIDRFVIGLSKIVIIAPALSMLADYSFKTEGRDILLAWTGAFAYTLQIYYDFSGCMDMTIGIGKMFSIQLPENFNYPYISTSVSEFWRRWHITLGQWFKDYIYIPLGGSRKGSCKTIRNLLIVWIITGLWHGANWTFVLWGLWNFIFIAFEKLNLERRKAFPALINWLSTFIIVSFGWVIFRSVSMQDAMNYLKTMFGLRFNQLAEGAFFEAGAIIASNKIVYMIALVGIFPIKEMVIDKLRVKNTFLIQILKIVILVILFLVDIAFVFKSRYAAPIYFTF